MHSNPALSPIVQQDPSSSVPSVVFAALYCARMLLPPGLSAREAADDGHEDCDDAVDDCLDDGDLGSWG